jgi:hypothetical protein
MGRDDIIVFINKKQNYDNKEKDQQRERERELCRSDRSIGKIKMDCSGGII